MNKRVKDYTGTIEGNLQCIEDLGPQHGHNRVLKIKCLDCGREFYLRPYQFKQRQHKCLINYVGMSNGVLTCIEDLGTGTINGHTAHLLKVKCSRCGKESVVKAYRINTNMYVPKSCTHCVKELMKEIADEKFAATRNFRRRYHSILGNAKCRNIQVSISKEEIENLLNQECYYCGKPKANGIDRVDSSKGYTADNVVPCCEICNKMKNKFSLNVFLEKVARIYNKFFIEGSTTIPKGSTLQADGSGKRRNPHE